MSSVHTLRDEPAWNTYRSDLRANEGVYPLANIDYASRRLVGAVIIRAVRDVDAKRVGIRVRSEAREFLLSETCARWLELLGADPNGVRKWLKTH